MEVIEKVLTYKRPDSFNIYPFGDSHFGSINCAEGEVEKQVAIIKADPRALVIGMGDYCDCILKDDKRFQQGGLAKWVAPDNIAESQRVRVREVLKPIANKIICLLDGNHELDIRKKFQYNMTWNLCSDLGVPYGGYQCFISLIFRRTTAAEDDRSGDRKQYIIHAWHGAGASQTEGARLMRLMRLVNDIEADIYLMGHLHAITAHTPDRLTFRRGKIKSVRLAAVTTGSWLLGYRESPSKEEPIPPTYIEEKGYKPARIGCPVVKIHPDSDLMIVEA